MPEITILTPTYNRAYILEKLYESLLNQRFSDFEWIIVDDGSTDSTAQLCSNFIKNTSVFHIRYVKQINGGKHRAINNGIQHANGRLFFIVDSDDQLPADALQQIIDVERTISGNNKNNFCGVCGLRGYIGKDVAIGNSFDKNEKYIDITSLQREHFNISGDKAEVFYTNVLKKYPFPEIAGENFITEAVVWDRIAEDGYKMRYFNKIVYLCEYLPDGLTAHNSNLFRENPKGYSLFLSQSFRNGRYRGLQKLRRYCEYYNDFKKLMTLNEMADNLKQSHYLFKIELFVARVIHKAEYTFTRL